MMSNLPLPTHQRYALALGAQVAANAHIPQEWVKVHSINDIAWDRSMFRVDCLGLTGSFTLDNPVSKEGIEKLTKGAHAFAMWLWGEKVDGMEFR